LKSEANLPIPIGAAVADVGAGSVEWLLPTSGGRTVGDGFAYAFAHHWGSTWNCRYSGLPAAAFRLPIAPQSTSRDVFQLAERSLPIEPAGQAKHARAITAKINLRGTAPFEAAISRGRLQSNPMPRSEGGHRPRSVHNANS
jgi:hypothetical protein